MAHLRRTLGDEFANQAAAVLSMNHVRKLLLTSKFCFSLLQDMAMTVVDLRFENFVPELFFKSLVVELVQL